MFKAGPSRFNHSIRVSRFFNSVHKLSITAFSHNIQRLNRIPYLSYLLRVKKGNFRFIDVSNSNINRVAYFCLEKA